MRLRKQVERVIKEWNPDQPRNPAGSPDGGRWASVGSAARMAAFPISRDLRRAADLLAAHGFKTFVVGGAVRDFLAGKAPHDFDLATDARPEQTKAVFAGKVKFDAGGEEHGIVRVKVGEEVYEIATLRHDVETDGKHAKVRFTTNVVDDLQRRDLTFNALAYDLGSGTLYGPGDNGDPTPGLDDLKNKVGRLVGDPRQRLIEDWSRGPRLLRISTKQGARVDPASMRAVQDAVARGEYPNPRLSAEKVRDEFIKTLALPDADKGLRLWKESGLLFAYFPELKAAEFQSQNRHHGDVKVLEHIFRTVPAASIPENLPTGIFDQQAETLGVSPREAALGILRLTMLMHDIAKPETAKEKADTPGEYSFIGHELKGAEKAREIGRRLKLPNVLTDLIAMSVGEHMAVPHPGATGSSIRRWGRSLAEKNKGLLDSGFDPVEWMLAVRAADWGAQGRVRAELDTGFSEIRAALSEAPVLSAKPAVDGATVMRITGLKPGREIGQIVKVVAEFKDQFPQATDDQVEAEVMRAFRSLRR